MICRPRSVRSILSLGDTDISTFYWSAAHQNFGRYKPSLEHLGQVEALPRIEVNVCFRVLIPESGLADFGQKPKSIEFSRD